MKKTLFVLFVFSVLCISMLTSIYCKLNDNSMLLKGIGSHFSVYQVAHDGNNPRIITDSINDDYPEYKQKCIEFSKNLTYRGSDLDETCSGEMILAYETLPLNYKFATEHNLLRFISLLFFIHGTEQYRNVLFADGTVMPRTEQKFIDDIAKDNLIRKSIGLKEKQYVQLPTGDFRNRESFLVLVRVLSLIIVLIIPIHGFIKNMLLGLAVFFVWDLIFFVLWNDTYTYVVGYIFLIVYILIGVYVKQKICLHSKNPKLKKQFEG